MIYVQFFLNFSCIFIVTTSIPCLLIPTSVLSLELPQINFSLKINCALFGTPKGPTILQPLSFLLSFSLSVVFYTIGFCSVRLVFGQSQGELRSPHMEFFLCKYPSILITLSPKFQPSQPSVMNTDFFFLQLVKPLLFIWVPLPFADIWKIPQLKNWGKCAALLMYFTSLNDQSAA